MRISQSKIAICYKSCIIVKEILKKRGINNGESKSQK